MPGSLRRYQLAGDLHFITFSCYHRLPKLSSPGSRAIFERALEHARRKYRFAVIGYVVMPEHVHLLAAEPAGALLSRAIQSLRQSVARTLALRAGQPFWQARYYDFNVWSRKKQTEKLRYIHRNPVKRGLVSSPEKWPWSSYRHYLTGEPGTVEIESHWTEFLRMNAGIHPTISRLTDHDSPP